MTFVLSFAGATLGNSLIYIFPALMFRGAVKKNSDATAAQKREVYFAMFSLIIGVVMGGLGAKMAVQSLGA